MSNHSLGQFWRRGAAHALAVACVMLATPAMAGVMLHCTFDSMEAIQTPDIVSPAIKGKALEAITTGKGTITFEPSPHGKAVRLHGNLRNNELIRLNPGSIDLSRSGRMDFTVRFNRDPHTLPREFYLIADTRWPITFQMEVLPYSNGQSNLAAWVGTEKRGIDKLLYASCGDKYQPGGPWSSVKTGEWHSITLIWWKNQGKDDTIQLFIDGRSTEKSMKDVTGKLPDKGSWAAVHLGGNAFGDFTNDISLDDLWIFDNPDDSPEAYGSAIRPGQYPIAH